MWCKDCGIILNAKNWANKNLLIVHATKLFSCGKRLQKVPLLDTLVTWVWIRSRRESTCFGKTTGQRKLGGREALTKELSNASKNYQAKLGSLFDIAKPDIEFRLKCEIDWKFVQDQRTERKSTFGTKDTKLLARLERYQQS